MMNKNYIAILGAILLFAVVFFFPRSPNTQTGNPDIFGLGSLAAATSSGAAASAPQTPRVVPAGMREYKNTTYHFSLVYPQELEVTEQNEGGGAATIVFQNIKSVEGFQLFIVPYNKPQVSEERFKQDEPSGVRNTVTSIVVDGATGAAFYSEDAALGETREVWFVHGGYLYEITTLKSLDSWFASILSTWRFL